MLERWLLPLNGEYGALAVPVVGNSVRVTTVPVTSSSELTLVFEEATLAVPAAAL